MKVGDSVGGLNYAQRSSLTQALTRIYGGKNRKAFEHEWRTDKSYQLVAMVLIECGEYDEKSIFS